MSTRMPPFAAANRVSAGQTAANPQIVRLVITQMPTHAPLSGTGSGHHHSRAGTTGTIGHHPTTGLANPAKISHPWVLADTPLIPHRRWCVLTSKNGCRTGGNHTRSLCQAVALTKVALTKYATEEFPAAIEVRFHVGHRRGECRAPPVSSEGAGWGRAGPQGVVCVTSVAGGRGRPTNFRSDRT